MNRTEELSHSLLDTLRQMHIALDERRWRRMPALRQELMTLFAQYQQAEICETALGEMKQILHCGMGELIIRHQQRAAELSQKMAQHRTNKEGVLAYSMMTLLTEQS